MRHAGKVYGHSKNRAPGSKHFYREIYSGSSWNQFVRGHVTGSLLQVCCGASRLGDVRVDLDPTAPAVNCLADMRRLPFPDGSFDTVCCDPIYSLPHPDRIHLQRELARVARKRLLFKAPWIPRAAGWKLTSTMLIASHTCANVAILAVLDRAASAQMEAFK